MIAVGIDPGVNGGIVALHGAGGEVIVAEKMPDTERDILAVFRRIQVVAGNVPGDPHPIQWVHALLEHVHSMPDQGIVSAFTFGQGFGGLRMALTAVDIPFDLAGPRKWQPVVGVIYPPKIKKTEKKNISKARAQQLFPSVKVTHALADALLIAEACRRWHGAR